MLAALGSGRQAMQAPGPHATGRSKPALRTPQEAGAGSADRVSRIPCDSGVGARRSQPAAGTHVQAPLSRGSQTAKVDPWPGSEATSIRPPWLRVIQ